MSSSTTGFPPPNLFHSKLNHVFPKNQILGQTLSFSSKKNSYLGFTVQTSSQTSFMSAMSEESKLEVKTTHIPDGYSKELEIAVRAVHMACLLCQRVQENLLSQSSDHVRSKDDDSPVTIAGNKNSFLSILCLLPFPNLGLCL